MSNKVTEDLSAASEALRDKTASKRERHNAGQDLANRKWELYYKKQTQSRRVSSRDRLRGR